MRGIKQFNLQILGKNQRNACVLYLLVDGTWTDWGSWGACNVECGDGQRGRNRTCEGRVGDGAPCPGNDTSREDCFVQCDGKQS